MGICSTGSLYGQESGHYHLTLGGHNSGTETIFAGQLFTGTGSAALPEAEAALQLRHQPGGIPEA